MGEKIEDMYCPKCKKVSKHRLTGARCKNIMESLGVLVEACFDACTANRFGFRLRWTCIDCDRQDDYSH